MHHRVKRVLQAVRMWWGSRRLWRQAGDAAAERHRQRLQAAERRAKVLPLSCLQRRDLVLVSVEGSGIALLPGRRARRWTTAGRGQGGGAVANLVLGSAALPARLTPSDLGCSHVMLVPPDSSSSNCPDPSPSSAPSPGIRCLVRHNDDLLPWIRE